MQSQFETVYRAEPHWAKQALVVLRQAGLRAEMLDDPTFGERTRAFYLYTVRVGVPAEERAAAEEILARWAQENSRDAEPLSASVGKSLALVVGPPLVLWALFVATRTPLPDWLMYVGAAWVIATVAAVGIAQRRAIADQDRSKRR